MKKYIFAVITLLIFINSTFAEKIDNIILLDTSMSMFPYYSGTIEYLIEDIVEKQLEPGDSFHLLSFNDFPEYEISRTIKSESELQDILNRILLLQPVGQYTDLISAFSYLYEYVDNLPANSIKRLIILTDGIHDPPPQSIYPLSDNNKEDIIKISENMRRQGWKVSLIQFPLQNYNSNATTVTENKDNNFVSSQNDTISSGSSGKNLFPEIAATLDEKIVLYEEGNNDLNHEITGAPEIVYPKPLGTVGSSFEAVFKFINHSEKPVLLKLVSILLNNDNILNTEITVMIDPDNNISKGIPLQLPENFKNGFYNSEIELIFKDSFRAYPRKGLLEFNFDSINKNYFSGINTRMILYTALVLFFLVIMIFIIIKIVGSMHSASESSFSTPRKDDLQRTTFIKSGSKKSIKGNIRKKNPGDIVVEMTVLNQNRHIGQRNIHILSNGFHRSVGGAGSEYFLIFIIPTGKRIAELIMEDGIVKFIPKAKEFFPDLKKVYLEDCLSVPIRVINMDGVETCIEFNEWISPVDKLNRVMHLLDLKGKPDFNY